MNRTRAQSSQRRPTAPRQTPSSRRAPSNSQQQEALPPAQLGSGTPMLDQASDELYPPPLQRPMFVTPPSGESAAPAAPADPYPAPYELPIFMEPEEGAQDLVQPGTCEQAPGTLPCLPEEESEPASWDQVRDLGFEVPYRPPRPEPDQDIIGCHLNPDYSGNPGGFTCEVNAGPYHGQLSAGLHEEDGQEQIGLLATGRIGTDVEVDEHSAINVTGPSMRAGWTVSGDTMSFGAQAGVAEVSATETSGPHPDRADDSVRRLGFGEGIGAGVRLHYGDADQDQHREWGLGVDAGAVTTDYYSEEPLLEHDE